MRDILVVEDGLHERERLSQLFTAAGLSVECAEGVADAEKLLEIQTFRLAVLDIGLGDKSGSVLFERLNRLDEVPYIIILTGNPSLHLKQRFLDEGAAAYVVKASPAASNDSLLETVRNLLGASTTASSALGIPLSDFLKHYLDEASRALFLEEGNEVPNCAHCGSTSYVVSFSHKTQLPPRVEGRVVCTECGKEMDPEIA